MADYKSAIWMPVPEEYVFVNRWGYTPRYIILHKTAGGSSAQGTAAYFQAGSDGNHVSSHYIVGQDGTVVQCVAEKDGSGANGILEVGHDSWWNESINPNLITFSIESVDPATDNSTPMPQAQKDALFPLVKDICTRHNIPMRPADANGGIAGHNSIAPLTRARCPGNFAWNELWTYLEGHTTMGIPQNWTDDGTTLTAPNGHKVVKGFRDYILTHNWNKDNYPLEEEHAETQLELSNPSLGGGTQQTFRFSLLGWTTTTGVIEEYIGAEYLVYKQKALTPSPSTKSLTKALSDLAACSVILQTVQHDLAS